MKKFSKIIVVTSLILAVLFTFSSCVVIDGTSVRDYINGIYVSESQGGNDDTPVIDNGGVSSSHEVESSDKENETSKPDEKLPDKKGESVVTLVYSNGQANKSFYVKNESNFATPEDPEKENFIFVGWYKDEKLTKKYDFSEEVTSDLTLYAKYVIDGAKITNLISQDTIKSVVKIYNKSYNSKVGSSNTSQGSGVCFHIENGYYYVLTNCHVALKNISYSKQEITVVDYAGNEYIGYIYVNPADNVSAISPDYDLACIYFKPKADNDIKALEIGSDPEKLSDVISLGAPHGQSNCISFGNVYAYGKVDLSDTDEKYSNVKFDVINHNSYIDGGSSGGPLISADMKIIGLNYAGNDKSDGDEVRSFAIPASKISEFLDVYVYVKK